MKVLVVDDEASVRTYLKTLLESDGYEVLTASSIEDAIKKFEKEEFDVVILDLVLDKEDGYELLKVMKRKDPSVPVIVITGYASIDSAVSTLKEGAYDYITKPFKAETILNTVRKAVEWREMFLELEQRRKELSESKKRYQTLFDEISDAVLVFDSVGRIVDANVFATRLFGYSKEELLGMNIFDLYGEEGYAEVSPSIMKGFSAYFELELKRKDGSTIVGEMSARGLELGGERYYQAVIRDITQRKSLEQTLEREKEESKEYAEIVKNFVSSELKKAVEYVENELARERIERVISFVENTHLWRKEHPVVEMELDEVIERAVQRFKRFYPRASVWVEQSGLSVMANPLFEEVILQLLEYSAERGEGVVHVDITAKSLNDEIILTMTDNAPAPPEEERERLQKNPRELSDFHLYLAKKLGEDIVDVKMEELVEGEPNRGTKTTLILKREL
jgi:PAS domain S-box-containing protein